VSHETALAKTQRHSDAEHTASDLADIIGALDQGLVIFDSDLRFVTANKSYWELAFPPDHQMAAKGTPFRDLMHETYDSGQLVLSAEITFDAFADRMHEWIETTGPEQLYRLADDRVVSLKALRSESGSYLIVATDVTDQQNAEQRAREMLIDIFRSLETGIIICDANMRFVYANPAWYDICFSGTDISPPKPGEHALENMIGLARQGLYIIPDSLTADEYVHWIFEEISKGGRQVPVRFKNGRSAMGSSVFAPWGGAVLTVREITNPAEALGQIPALETYSEPVVSAAADTLKTAIDDLDTAMALIDADARFVYANLSFRASCDPTNTLLVPGRPMRDIHSDAIRQGQFPLPPGLPEDALLDHLDKIIATAAKGFELPNARGRELLGSVHANTLGSRILTIQDVTDQRTAERELAEMRVAAQQNEKLSALGELLAGVAHELNNPLSVVFGYSQMLQGRVDDPVLAERVDFICQSAERAAKIVKTFLAMARQRPTKIENCSINEVVNTALEVSSYSLKSNGTVVSTAFDTDAPLVAGDFDQLAQVFSNLIINAGHAVQDQREAGEITVRSFFDARKNETVVEVRDNGPGIPHDLQRRIFEPFFTTKDVGQGTGVGLAFSHRIVQSHGGTLDLQSAPCAGTSFFVRLSAAEPDQWQDKTVLPHTPVRGVRRLLVVDDEVGVARLIRDVLTEDGFDVTITTSPRDALRMAKDQAFDVILSDYKMPDMDGQAFYHAMRKVAPDAANRIGFVTGDAMSKNVADFLSESGRPHIEKPIIKDELMALLRDVQSGKRP